MTPLTPVFYVDNYDGGKIIQTWSRPHRGNRQGVAEVWHSHSWHVIDADWIHLTLESARAFAREKFLVEEPTRGRRQIEERLLFCAAQIESDPEIEEKPKFSHQEMISFRDHVLDSIRRAKADLGLKNQLLEYVGEWSPRTHAP